MKIFITGASGFIGSHLLPLLIRDGHELLCLGRSGGLTGTPSFLHGDLYDPESYRHELQSFRPDCIIHLGWGGLPDYSLDNCRQNLLAGINLLEVAVHSGCSRIFVAGTCWEYGKSLGAMKESDVGVEPGMFAAFKLALQSICQSYCLLNKTRLIWLRPFFVYGPGQRGSSLIPSCYSNLRMNIIPSIRNPTALNDFIHVTDVARAIRMLVESDDANGIYNIGSGQPVAVWEVVNAIANSLGLPPIYDDMHSLEVNGLWADTSKMHSTGWRPTLTLNAGIAQTIETWKTKTEPI